MKKLVIAVFAASVMLCGSVILMSAPTNGNNWHVGADGTDIELYNGTLQQASGATVDLSFDDLTLSGDVTLGDDLVVGDDLSVSGDSSVTGKSTLGQLIFTPDYETLIASQTRITPTSASSLMILGSTQNVTLGAGAGASSVISTTSVSAGTYLILTSTSVTVTMPTGTAHFVVGVSSPVSIVANSMLSLIFNGNYWVCVSSNNVQ